MISQTEVTAMHVALSIRGRQTRKQILDAALTQFADRGYTGTSIHDITEAARVAKPALYYHFGSKAGLFRALMDRAEDETLSMFCSAAAGAAPLPDRMVEISVAAFRLAVKHCDVIRLALGHSFLAKGAVPSQALCPKKSRRRHGVMREFMEQGLADGTFRPELDAEQLTLSFVGLLRSHIMAHLANPRYPMTRRTAEEAVSLFLRGAAQSLPRRNDV